MQVEGIDGKIIQDGNRILLIQSPTSLNNNGSGYKEKSEPEDVQRQSHNATQTCAVTVLLRSNGMKELESVVASVHRRNVTTWQAIKSNVYVDNDDGEFIDDDFAAASAAAAAVVGGGGNDNDDDDDKEMTMMLMMTIIIKNFKITMKLVIAAYYSLQILFWVIVTIR